MSVDKAEWRVLVDFPINITDPVQVRYCFARVKNGKITRTEKWRNGFNNDAKDRLKEMLEGQLEALEKPFLQEKHETKLVEV